MAIINETHTIVGEGITVSLLVWRRFRTPAPGVVEQVLDANPGLAAAGLFIPVGTVVTIPVDTDEDFRSSEAIRLWDET